MIEVEPRCKNCRFYIVTADHQPGEGDCTSPHIARGYNVPAIPYGGIQVEDDEGWGIVISPEYGCLHFELKIREEE